MSFGPRHQATCKICYDAGRQEEAFQHSTRWNFHDGRGSIVTCPYLRCQTCANPNCVNHGWVRNPDHAHTTKYCEAPWPVEMQEGGCYEHLKYVQGAFTPEMYQMQMQMHMHMQSQMYAQSQLWQPQPEQEEFSVMKPAEPTMFQQVEEKVAETKILTPEMLMADIANAKKPNVGKEPIDIACNEVEENPKQAFDKMKDSANEDFENFFDSFKTGKDEDKSSELWGDMSDDEEEEEDFLEEKKCVKDLWKRALLFAKVVARFNICAKKRNDCSSSEGWTVRTTSKKLVASVAEALEKIEKIKAHNLMVEGNFGFEEGETDQEWLDRMAYENNRFPRLCRHFEKKGCCSYGKKSGKSCNFLHIPKKKRLPVIRFKVALPVDKKKKVMQKAAAFSNRFAFEDSDSD
jgi:hypothetical protein